jgi:RNA polymerase-binding transcription factor DksA
MSFTLGLSGWSANDWSAQGNFDLLAPRQTVDTLTLERVYQALSKHHMASCASLATELGLDESIVKAALAAYSQHGQVLYDLNKNLYRIRALCREPIPLEQLRLVTNGKRRLSTSSTPAWCR